MRDVAGAGETYKEMITEMKTEKQDIVYHCRYCDEVFSVTAQDDNGVCRCCGSKSLERLGPTAPIGTMPLRDWFAGMAMQGLNANPEFSETHKGVIADWAYKQADAMIAQREKQ